MEDKKAQFDKVYEEYVDAIYRFCLYKTSDRKQAEDLTQESFIRFWVYISKNNSPLDNTKSFIYQIARNLIIDYYRKNKPFSLDKLLEEGFEPVNNENSDTSNEAEKNIAINIINKLDEKYSSVVYLRLVEDMSTEEIAEVLKITGNNATVRLHRGMKQLKLYIEKQNENK